MGNISVLVNRYGGDMIEVDFGNKETLQKIMVEKIRASLHDMADDATSGKFHYDLEKGTGLVRYVRERKFDPPETYSDEYALVEVPAPGFKTGHVLVLGTEGMIAEAVIFCPDDINPMDFAMKKAKEQGFRITASTKDNITVLDSEGRKHFWNSIQI